MVCFSTIKKAPDCYKIISERKFPDASDLEMQLLGNAGKD